MQVVADIMLRDTLGTVVLFVTLIISNHWRCTIYIMYKYHTDVININKIYEVIEYVPWEMY